MQTVWSRVAQVRCKCNCRSCISSTTAVTRRATTASATRGVRFGNAFTVLSSSIAATAAFVDSKRKDIRRREWERVISETRAEIEANEVDQQNRLAILANIADRESFGDSQGTHFCSDQDEGFGDYRIRKVNDPYGPRSRTPASDLKRDSWGDVLEWAAQQNEARAASGFQDWRGPPLSLLQKLSTDQLEELLQDDRLLRRFFGGEDCLTVVDETSRSFWSSKKLRTLEWSVAKLVYHLLLHCSKNPLSDDNQAVTSILLSEDGTSSNPLPKAGGAVEKASGHSSEEEAPVSSHRANIYSKLAHIDSRLKALNLDRKDDWLYEGFESPRCPTYRGCPSHGYGNVKKLNQALYLLLHGMERERDLTPLMTKICYNLLTSKNPPNINTYNLLLVRFCQLGNEELVRAVMTSMRESHIRPNEVTHCTILRFYTTTNSVSDFKEYVNRMNGLRGGLALAKAGQQISPIATRTVRSFGQGGAKLAEKARMNGEVYVSLIVGALKFLSSHWAMYYYRKMISEGWKPNTEILTAILRHCCYRSDWHAGLLVWKQILEIGHRASTLSYQWMLRLCQVCEQQDWFDHYLREGVERGALPVSMLQLPNEMKSQNIASILEYAETIRRHNVRRMLPVRTWKWIQKLYSDDSQYALENAFQACTDEFAVRAMAERLKAIAKDTIGNQSTTSLFLERRLKNIVKRIDYTIERFHGTLPQGSAAELKYRLTNKIKIIEREKAELTGGARSVASGYTKEIKMSLVKKDRNDGVAQRSKATSLADTENSPANPVNIASAPNEDIKVPIQPEMDVPKQQLLPMIPHPFPTGLSIQDPGPWDDIKRPLAATA